MKPTEEVAKVPFEETVGNERLEREVLVTKGDSERERSTSEGSSSKTNACAGVGFKNGGNNSQGKKKRKNRKGNARF